MATPSPIRRRMPLVPSVFTLLCLVALPTPAADVRQHEAAPRVLSQPAPPLVVSDDGALVIDTRARLAWPRCVEGMQWNGHTCTGVAQLLSYGEAQTVARKRWQDSGVRWRLPRVNELRRLVNRNAQPRTVDATLFPNAPADWHWSGTASVNTAAVNPYSYGNVARGGEGESQITVQQAWAVDMASGEARGDMGRASKLALRLVRPAP